MKVNPLLPWARKFQHAEKLIYGLPFLLLGGKLRAARIAARGLTVTKHRLVYPHLPKAFDGMKVTHLTDLHLGPLFTVPEQLPRVVEACRELDSDLICCTGDWVDYALAPLPSALNLLATLKPPLGWTGVLGNHDYRESRWQMIKLLRAWMGPRLLINDFVRFTVNGSSIDVCGLDFAVGGRRLERGLHALQARRPEPAPFTIGLTHYPDNFDAFRAAQKIDLGLSGHTHGGQVSWTLSPKPAYGPVTDRYKYPRGLYENYGSRLYVGCGLSSSIPLRINCPPEIAQFTLVRE